MRLFVGVPVAGHDALAALTGELRHSIPGFRPVPPDSWHVTLRFLGEADSGPVGAALATALQGRHASTLDVIGMGAFPAPAGARVVWAGVESDRLDEVAEAVRTALPGEQRPFHAHVTLGRVAPACDVRGVVDRFQGAKWAAGPLDRVVLWQSILAPGGPRYEALRSYPLR